MTFRQGVDELNLTNLGELKTLAVKTSPMAGINLRDDVLAQYTWRRPRPWSNQAGFDSGAGVPARGAGSPLLTYDMMAACVVDHQAAGMRNTLVEHEGERETREEK